MPQTGAQLIARAIKERGIDTIFSLSGNQILPLYDALLAEGVRLITTRHEATAVHMADAAAQITRSAQIALVTAGPGHSNALTALGVAHANEAPVLLLSGAAETSGRGTHAFQEFPQAEVAAFFTKWSGYADVPAQSGSMINRALDLAELEVPGPISLGLPYDTQLVFVETPQEAPRIPSAHWTSDSLEPLVLSVSKSERPIILASPWVARDPMAKRVAEQLGAPIFAIESPRGASDPYLFGAESALEEADCIILLAPWDFSVRSPHVLHPRALGIIQAWPEIGPSEPGFQRLRARPSQILNALDEVRSRASTAWAREVSDAQTAAREEVSQQPRPDGVSGVHPMRLVESVRKRLKAGDFVGMDGGEYVQWMRLGVAQGPWHSTINGKYGPVGPGLPDALGARAALGNGPSVVAFAGDGGFGYHAMEIETAVREQLPVIAIVGTDGKWAAEWHLQARHYGEDRRVGTELTESRFELMAEALGAVGIAVKSDDEINDALDRAWKAMQAGKPVVVNVYVAAIPSPAALH